MDGTVTSYLSDKGYGFATGNDGHDYFVHQSDITHQAGLIEGQRIAFESSVTPKGYRVRKVRPARMDGATRYALADGVTAARSDAIHGWDVLVTSRWIIHGSARGASEKAKDELQRRAKMIGANGVLGISHYATTGSESGAGHGTHHFTIHNFKGHPVILGRASVNGTHALEELGSIDARASELKTELVAQTELARKLAIGIALGVMLAVAAIAGAIVHSMPNMTTFVLVAAAVFSAVASILCWQWIAKDYDSWLELD